MVEVVERHRRACAGFGRAVAGAGDQWERPSPCTEWDARALVEHVIGFHEVLLLRPLGVHAHRPRDDPAGRWAATERAIFLALDEPGVLERSLKPIETTGPPVRRFLPALTTDVLVHTWDLARAVDADPALDPDLCGVAFELSNLNQARIRDSGMYAPAVPVSRELDAQARLLGLLGRDPTWTS